MTLLTTPIYIVSAVVPENALTGVSFENFFCDNKHDVVHNSQVTQQRQLYQRMHQLV